MSDDPRVGQKVVVRMRGRRESHPGVVIGLDTYPQPGVEVRFDNPVNGLDTCYATYEEVRSQ